MKNKIFLSVIILLIAFTGCNKKEYDVLHQISPVSNLISGDYDGVISYQQIHKYGDFGIGTFDKINGEMVGLDGKFYQVKSNGEVSIANNTQTTPYASVHFFKADKFSEIKNVISFAEIKNKLDEIITDKNFIYGIKITALFSYIKLRSPQAQKKPYPSLLEALKNQAIFEKENIYGTIVGYYSPRVLSQIIVNGYHFHFISDDKQSAGHILDLKTSAAQVQIDKISSIQLHIFPTSSKNISAVEDVNNLFQSEKKAA